MSCFYDMIARTRLGVPFSFLYYFKVTDLLSGMSYAQEFSYFARRKVYLSSYF
ncbi:MAG: hypothetical protein QG653_103 [Patescibacteria group bacterium]|nr:hypothetical protein [Patescibacteria group bacterium]